MRLGDIATWRSSYNIVRSETAGSVNAGTLTAETFNGTLAGAPATLSDFFANQAMHAAGATEMLAPYRAAGLRSAMYTIPALMLLCSNESHFVNGAVIQADDGFSV